MPNRNSVTKIKGGLLDRLYHLIYRNPLYLYTLMGPTPKRLLGTPPELIPGNAIAGQIILDGNLLFAKERRQFTSVVDIPKNASPNWQTYVHSFEWLSDLRAVENNQARLLALKHVTTWLKTYKKWSPLAWQADVLGHRLANWIIHFGFFAREAPQEFYDLFFLEVIKQTRHLNRSIVKTKIGPERVQGLKGLIYCGISLPNLEHYKNLTFI